MAARTVGRGLVPALPGYRWRTGLPPHSELDGWPPTALDGVPLEPALMVGQTGLAIPSRAGLACICPALRATDLPHFHAAGMYVHGRTIPFPYSPHGWVPPSVASQPRFPAPVHACRSGVLHMPLPAWPGFTVLAALRATVPMGRTGRRLPCGLWIEGWRRGSLEARGPGTPGLWGRSVRVRSTAGQGFEPQLPGSGPGVLPLDEPAMVWPRKVVPVPRWPSRCPAGTAWPTSVQRLAHRAGSQVCTRPDRLPVPPCQRPSESGTAPVVGCVHRA
jgi:hypothetical protein